MATDTCLGAELLEQLGVQAEGAADRGFSPVSIIEIPQLIGGVGSG